MNKNTPSPKWSKLSKALFNTSTGRHCHWCKYITFEDGCAFCVRKGCEFNDNVKIREWDGREFATRCDMFELSDCYKDDANFNNIKEGN